MRRMMAAGVVVALAMTLTPAGALPPPVGFAIATGDMVEAWHTEDSETEITRFFAFEGSEIYPGDVPQPSWGGCVDLFRDNVLVEGCGELRLQDAVTLVTATVTGTIDAARYTYIPLSEGGPDFIYEDQDQITVEVTFTGTGEPRLAEPQNGVGVCGLPPDVPSGANAFAMVPLERSATLSGSLASEALGSIDLVPTAGELRSVSFAFAGNNCLRPL